MKYIYFIQAVDGTGPIKIGSSDKPLCRLSQCSSAVHLAKIAEGVA